MLSHEKLLSVSESYGEILKFEKVHRKLGVIQKICNANMNGGGQKFGVTLHFRSLCFTSRMGVGATCCVTGTGQCLLLFERRVYMRRRSPLSWRIQAAEHAHTKLTTPFCENYSLFRKVTERYGKI